jgi:hypothetical protein
MHSGQLGPERAVLREQGADSSDLPALLIPRERVWSNQFQLHSALESGDCQALDDLPGNVTPALSHYLPAFLCQGRLVHCEQ